MTANLKVLMITMRADFGGGPTHIDMLLRTTVPIDFYIACPDDKPYFSKWKTYGNIKHVFEIPHRSIDVVKIIRLILFVKKNKISIVHSHGKGGGLYSRLIKIVLPGTKAVHTFHGLHLDEYSRFKQALYILVERIFCALSDKLINVSYSEMKLCEKYRFFHPDKTVVIHNGVEKSEKLNVSRTELLGKHAQKFVVITVSRFDMVKNMRLAYKIARQIRNDDSIVFVWVGDGEERASIEKDVEMNSMSNVVFTGFKSNVNEYLSSADMYLSTSFREGLPIALLEAGMHGLPLVATNVVGNNEVVVPEVNGFLFDINNIDSAIELITRLKNDAVLRKDLSEKSRSVCLEKFSADAMRKKTYDIYYSVKTAN
jgi:glycosyltransferase involved in cell wall biosynthesis